MSAETGPAYAFDAARREECWRGLIRHLADVDPSVTILKNAESALTGTGDLDVLLGRPGMRRVVEGAVEWSRANDAQCMVCDHVPDGPHIVVVVPGQAHALVVDLKWRRSLFGATLITARAAQECSARSEFGPLQLTQGAEGVVKLCLYGIDGNWGLDYRKLDAKEVLAALREDPEGAMRTAALMSQPTWLLSWVIGEAAARRPGRLAASALKARLLVGAVAEPGTGPRRLYYKAVQRANCPIMSVVKFNGRRVPGDPARWFAASKEAHPQQRKYYFDPAAA